VPFMYCDPPATIAQIRPAVDQTHAGSGRVTLSGGATFEITTPHPANDQSEFVVKLRQSDHIQMCYAPSQRWADAGPTARMAIVGDVESKAYIYVLAYPRP
jgi:predicted secreted protein